MATIITRAGKGSPLTHNEVDANFVNLNDDKIEGIAVQDDAAPIVTSPTLNFTGSGVTVTDVAGVATVNVPGAVSEWTYVALAADFTTTSTTQTGTGLKFTPPVGSAIEVEARLFLATSVNGNAPRPGFTYPSAGVLAQAGAIWANSAANARSFQQADINGGSLNLTTTGGNGYFNNIPAGVDIIFFVTDVSVTGDFEITLAGEVAATTTYTLRRNSFIRYRAVPAL